MKLNLGCGVNKLEGYVNVDMFPQGKPDVVFDLETTPWIWETSSVTAVMFNHSLEHMGADAKVFLAMMKELYRVSANGCIININVPHPRHDNFISDPTHVRPITPKLLSLFSKKLNKIWQEMGAANTPFGMYLDVDFEVFHTEMVLDAAYHAAFNEKRITPDELEVAVREKNNIVSEYKITMKVIK